MEDDFDPAEQEGCAKYSERCHKTRYPDKRAAVSAKNLIMRSHRRKRPKYLRCYPCPICHGWHLSHRS